MMLKMTPTIVIDNTMFIGTIIIFICSSILYPLIGTHPISQYPPDTCGDQMTATALFKPPVWGVCSYDVICSMPINLTENKFQIEFAAFGRWNMLIASRILNHGEDFSGFLNKNTAKYAGQLTTFVPTRKVENVEAFGHFTNSGIFVGTIYAEDRIYMEEVPAVVRKAGWGVAATSIVYKESQTPDFLVIKPNGDETQWRGPKLPDLGPIPELGAVDKVAMIQKESAVSTKRRGRPRKGDQNHQQQQGNKAESSTGSSSSPKGKKRRFL